MFAPLFLIGLSLGKETPCACIVGNEMMGLYLRYLASYIGFISKDIVLPIGVRSRYELWAVPLKPQLQEKHG